MKDADTISGYIDYLIHKYLVTASIMCDNDVCQRPLVYNFDVFLNVQTFVMSNMQILIRTHYCPHYPDFFGFYHNPIRFFFMLLYSYYINSFISSASCCFAWIHYVAIIRLSYSFIWLSVSILDRWYSLPLYARNEYITLSCCFLYPFWFSYLVHYSFLYLSPSSSTSSFSHYYFYSHFPH